MRSIPYSYVVLQFVPDVVTGERLNVGVLFCCPTAVSFTTIGKLDRIKAAFPETDVQALKRSLDDLAWISRGRGWEEGGAIAIAHSILPADDSSLQWSEMSTGISGTAPGVDMLRIVDRYLKA